MHSVDDNRETLEQIQYLIAEGRFAQALELLNAISPIASPPCTGSTARRCTTW